MTTHDLTEQIEQLDLQILNLVSDRVRLYRQLTNDGEDEVDDSDALAMWIEEATEKGLDEALVEKLAKVVIVLGKRSEE